MTEIRSLLRIPDFRRLWMAQVVSDFGDSLTLFTLLFLVQRLTGDETAVATVLIASALPTLVVGLVAGVWVDRWNLRRVMVVSDLVRAGLVLCLLFVQSTWMLYLIVFLVAATGTFFRPARQALLPRVVSGRQLLSANSLNEVTRVVAYTSGTAVSGLLVGMAGAFAPVFVIDAATFLVSASMVARVATRADPAPGGEQAAAGVFSELVEGLRVMIGSRWLSGVLVGAALAMFGLGAVNGLIVPFVVGDIGLSESWFGLLEGAQALGVVVAGTLTAVLSARFRPSNLISGGLVTLGALVAGFSLATGVVGLTLLMLAVGLAVAPVQASASTILQREAPSRLLGRAASALSAGTTGAQVGSLAIAGALASVLGVRTVFAVAGAVVVLAGLTSLFLFGLARRREPGHAPSVESEAPA
ncbi:MAG TPA: MFS transporter [Acidimicrobiia bacterium]|nr:MFS transporter [Acidimicrobiia bacterium]